MTVLCCLATSISDGILSVSRASLDTTMARFPRSVYRKVIQEIGRGGLSLHLPAILLAGTLAYSNTFGAAFHFDDMRNIVNNPLIRDFRYFVDLSEAGKLPGYQDFKMRYVGFLTFALNHGIHGLHVGGYHVFNLAVHLINAMLVYFLVLQVFSTPVMRAPGGGSSSALARDDSGERWVAFLSALLFVSHPIQTQAVTYIVQRFASLAAAFYLLSILAYCRWRISSIERRGPSFPTGYAVSLLCAVLAMKTKEIAVTLPVMLGLYEITFIRRNTGRAAIYLIPFVLSMLLVPMGAVTLDLKEGLLFNDLMAKSKVLTDMSRTDYVLTQFTVVATYLRLLILPVGQNFDYDHPVYRSLADHEVVISILIISAVIATGMWLMRASREGDKTLRLTAFGIFWLFIALIPESGLIPIVDLIYEHRVYLPSVGFFMAAATTCTVLTEKIRSRSPAAGKGASIVLAFIVLILVAGTFHRNRVWQSEVTLWEDVVRKSPNKERPRNTLGAVYLDTGQLERAYVELTKAVEINPVSWAAHVNLGTLHARRARSVYEETGSAPEALMVMQQAVKCYEKALALSPGSPEVHAMLAMSRDDEESLRGLISESSGSH